MGKQPVSDEALQVIQSLKAASEIYRDGIIDLKRHLEAKEESQQKSVKNLEQNTNALLEAFNDMSTKAKKLTKCMHATAQREKTRSTIFYMRTQGVTDKEIVESLLKNPPVVDPAY